MKKIATSRGDKKGQKKIPCDFLQVHYQYGQGEKAHIWLERRLERLVPVPHFMIIFTVPAPFRSLFRQHQRFAYAAFFAATSGIMKKPASEQTWFPGDVPGFFGVLHTWGRQLQYHPHIHYVVPGGAFSSEDHSRHPCRKAFYLPVRVAAKLVKHRMYTALKRNGLLSSVDAAAWSQD